MDMYVCKQCLCVYNVCAYVIYNLKLHKTIFLSN